MSAEDLATLTGWDYADLFYAIRGRYPRYVPTTGWFGDYTPRKWARFYACP